MTLGELLEHLKDFDLDREVILSSDEEGNRFQPLMNIYPGKFRKEYRRPWGDVGLEKLTPEDISLGYSQEDVIEDGVRALILTP